MKRTVIIGGSITLLLLGSFLTSLGIFAETQDELPEDTVVTIQVADLDVAYIKQNVTITLNVTNYHNTTIEAITFHQTIPDDLGLVDAQGGANFTANTIDYTWRTPDTDQLLTLGTNETLYFTYIVNGTEDGEFEFTGLVRYRVSGGNEVRSVETNELTVEIREFAPGNIQALQVITSEENKIEQGDNVTIELVLRNFHNENSIYNVTFVQKLPTDGLTLLSATGGIEETVKGNITERFINYTLPTPLAINETFRFQYMVNGSINGTYIISGGTIEYTLLVEEEPRTVDINSLAIEVGEVQSILPRPPKGTRDLGFILLVSLIILPVVFFALAALLTKGTRTRRP
jgi:hypothetical protein